MTPLGRESAAGSDGGPRRGSSLVDPPRRSLLAAIGPLALVGVAALLVRAAVVLDLSALPTGRVLIVDAAYYDRLARDILAGGWLPARGFELAPGYPYFLAAVYGLFGHSFLAARLLQAVLDAVSVVLLAAVAGRLFGRGAALATGLAGAFYGPLVFATALLGKETLAVFLTAVFLALWVAAATGEAGGRRRLALATAAGVALGASALLRENTLLLVPVVVGVTLLVPPGEGLADRRRRAAASGLLLVGFLLPLAPVVAANHRATGGWFLTSSQGGLNFLLGNSRGATGVPGPLSSRGLDPVQERADARRIAADLIAADSGRTVEPESLPPATVSRTLLDEALREIADEPASWVRLMGRKLFLVWNRYEIPDTEGYDLARSRSASLRVAAVDFGLLGPLALAGLGAGFHRRCRGVVALGLLAVGSLLSIVVFFVIARYRLPAVALLLPVAGYAVVALGGAVRRRDAATLAWGGAGLVLGAALAFTPAFSTAELRRHDAVLRYDQATAALAAAEGLDERAVGPGGEARRLLAEAIDELDRALGESPQFAAAHLARGVAHLRIGNLDVAVGSRADAVTAYRRSREDLAAAVELADRQRLPELAAEARRIDVVAAGNLERFGAGPRQAPQP